MRSINYKYAKSSGIHATGESNGRAQKVWTADKRAAERKQVIEVAAPTKKKQRTNMENNGNDEKKFRFR